MVVLNPLFNLICSRIRRTYQMDWFYWSWTYFEG